MKKICLCFIISLIFCTCFKQVISPTGDWKLKLINGYEMWRWGPGLINVGFVKDDSISYGMGIKEGELARIPENIIKFAVYNHYICAIVIPYGGNTEEYYILDTIEQKVVDFFSESEFNEKMQALGIVIDEWVETKNINAEWLRNNNGRNMWRF